MAKDHTGPTTENNNDNSTNMTGSKGSDPEPQSHEVTSKDNQQEQQGQQDQEKSEGDKTKASASGGRTQENREAIPTAGGEKLGEKHWGESQIVPDNPKPKPEEQDKAGVASSEGQPTGKYTMNFLPLLND